MLEILDGDRAGERSRLRDGMVLGRKDCDLNLRDSKVSSKHAKVELRSDGMFWLVDLESANGIKTGSGKVTELKLENGLTFGIGRISLKVIGIQGVFESTQPEIVVEELPVKPAPPAWLTALDGLFTRAISNAKSKPIKDFAPFSQTVRLLVRKGPQTGEEWTLGYGPRTLGASSVDLPLHEEGLPPRCFTLVPEAGDVVLQVAEAAKDRVRLNGKIVIDDRFVHTGDTIEIGDTQIEVILG
ncbi:MAG TPA: FHA domain-containing protein [Bdellovibrionales bacterium]|nr:FHA domain-containing protein [Bdellovibrionales bacterium]